MTQHFASTLLDCWATSYSAPSGFSDSVKKQKNRPAGWRWLSVGYVDPRLMVLSVG